MLEVLKVLENVSVTLLVHLFWCMVFQQIHVYLFSGWCMGSVSGKESETVRKLRCLRIWGRTATHLLQNITKRKVVKSEPGESCHLEKRT